MWRLVREELRLHLRTLLGAWGTCLAGICAFWAVVALVGAGRPRLALSWAALTVPPYLLLASAVVAWIAIGTDIAEHRLRLHALLPLPLSRLALSQVLLPALLLLPGVPLAHAGTALDQALFGPRSPWIGHAVLSLLAAHLLLLHQLTLAIREVSVLRERGRTPKALGILFVAGVFVADLVYGIPDSTVVLAPGLRLSAHIHTAVACLAAPLTLAILTAAFTVALFVHRRQLVR